MKEEKLREKQVDLVEANEEAAPQLDAGVASDSESSDGAAENDSKEEDDVNPYNDAALHAGRMSFAQKVLGNKFEVLDVIGQGGMGSVYKVRDTDTDRVVALKLLKPELCQDKSVLKRFQHEAASLAELEHDNIVTVYDHGITGDGAPYLVMQYLEGGTLSDRLKRDGKLKPEQTIALTIQICKALDYAHKKKLVHRDIKPSNVILVDAGQDSDALVQLVDFGIAKMLESKASNTTNLTQTGDIFGTPAYMSPEQCEGGEIDHRSDIYSVGCLLYEMLTGAQPFEGANAIQVAVKHINGTPEPFAEKLPDGHILRSLQEIVLKCMKKEKADRYQSVCDLIDDLKIVKSGRVVGYAEPPEADEAGSKHKPGRVLRFFHGAGQVFFGIFAFCWYMTLAIALGSSQSGSGTSERAAFILLASIGILFHLQITWRVLSRLKKRRTLIDWGEAFFLLSVFATYVLVLPLSISGLQSPVSDLLACATSFSLVSTWAIFSTVFVIVCFVAARRRVRSVFDRFKKWRDPSHVATKYARIPMSLGRAAPRLALCCSIMLIVFIAAFPTGASEMLCSYFSSIFIRANASLSDRVLESAVALNSDNWQAFKNLAEYRTAHGDLSKALAVLNTGLAKRPDDLNLLLARGKLKHEMKQYREALQDLDKVGEGTEESVARGRLYTAMGDFKKAEKAFSKSVQTADHYSQGTRLEDCYAGRGLAYYAEGNYRQAISDFSKAIETGYSLRESNYVRRALAYQAMGDASAARQNFETAVETTDGYENGASYLARAFAAKQIGKKEEYERLMQEAKVRGFGPEKLTEVVLPNLPLVTLRW